jgi:hypothetical protein
VVDLGGESAAAKSPTCGTLSITEESLAKLLSANFSQTRLRQTLAILHTMSLEERLVKVRDSPKGSTQFQVWKSP